MRNYHPVLKNTHEIRITLMIDSKIAHISYLIGGNCRGADLIDPNIFEDLNLNALTENDCNLTYNDVYNEYVIEFHDPITQEREGYYMDVNDLRKHIVKIEIVNCYPEQEPSSRIENEMLTLEQLRHMDGKPAWCYSYATHQGEWVIININQTSAHWYLNACGRSCAFGSKENYGTEWIAFLSEQKIYY